MVPLIDYGDEDRSGNDPPFTAFSILTTGEDSSSGGVISSNPASPKGLPSTSSRNLPHGQFDGVRMREQNRTIARIRKGRTPLQCFELRPFRGHSQPDDRVLYHNRILSAGRTSVSGRADHCSISCASWLASLNSGVQAPVRIRSAFSSSDNVFANNLVNFCSPSCSAMVRTVPYPEIS